MCRVEAYKVILLWKKMNEIEIRYLLTKNIDDYLPNNLHVGQDIDILVHPSDKTALQRMLQHEGYRRIQSLERSEENGYVLRGGMEAGECYEREGILLDICYQLHVSGLQPEYLFPLQQNIQDFVWEHRKWNEEKQWYELDDESMLVYCIARCIFDKKRFSDGYVLEIDKRSDLLLNASVQRKLYSIFFGFTIRLIEMLREKRYDDIYENYTQNRICDWRAYNEINPGSREIAAIELQNGRMTIVQQLGQGVRLIVKDKTFYLSYQDVEQLNIAVDKLFEKKQFCPVQLLKELPFKYIRDINEMLPDLVSVTKEQASLGSLLVREKFFWKIPCYIPLKQSETLKKAKLADLREIKETTIVIYNNQLIIRQGVDAALKKYCEGGDSTVLVYHLFFKENKYNMPVHPVLDFFFKWDRKRIRANLGKLIRKRNGLYE